MKNLFLIALLFTIYSCNETPKTTVSVPDKVLPSVFDNGDRIYLKIPTISGDTILVYTDTGGGFTAIYPQALKRTGLDNKIEKVNFDGELNMIINAEDIIPDPAYHPYMKKSMLDIHPQPFYMVPPPAFVKSLGKLNTEGFFGQYFFLDKAWTFDYHQQKIILHDQLDLSLDDPNTQKIGLKKNMAGKPQFGHPSFYFEVEGERIPALFDTGATFSLSDEASKNEFDGKSHMGGSFIARSIFDQWVADHPEWKVIEKGDVIKENDQEYTFDMIEVPKVSLGGIEVGPVWFSKRPDEAWSKGMIRSMDKVVKGAVGGSAFKYLVVSIDYKNELLSFKSK